MQQQNAQQKFKKTKRNYEQTEYKNKKQNIVWNQSAQNTETIKTSATETTKWPEREILLFYPLVVSIFHVNRMATNNVYVRQFDGQHLYQLNRNRNKSSRKHTRQLSV